MNLELRHLRLFDAIYAAASITRAAERLGLSQPTVSIGLGQLRRHFDDPLFVQTSAGMTPTPFADTLISDIRQTLASALHLSQSRARFTPATSGRRFRIAMSDASHQTLLPTLFAAIRRAAPAVTLEAFPIGGAVAGALATGDADIAIGLAPDLGSGFFQRVLFEQDWVCLHRTDERRGAMTIDAYQGAEHVEVSNGTGQHLLVAALAECGINRRIALSIPGFLGLASILRNADLVATLPRHIGQSLADLAGLATVDCPFPIATFQVKLHWHARYHQDPSNEWLRRVCISALADLR